MCDPHWIAKRYDAVRFTVADMHGIPRGRLIPAHNVTKAFKDGVETFAGLVALGPRAQVEPPMALDSIRATSFGNVLMRPATDTNPFHRVPWAAGGASVGQVLCDLHWMTDGTAQRASPRQVALRQISRLRDLGMRIKYSFEMEFMVFDKDGAPVSETSDNWSMMKLVEHEEMLLHWDKMVREIGVSTETWQAEAAAGQFEVTLNPQFDLDGADQSFLLRQAVKEMCALDNKHAAFMCVPRLGGGKNGFHFNFSVWSADEKRNLFHDADAEDGLSILARQWLAGVCSHTPALTAICAPTVNCYRRLHSIETAKVGDWGIDNRTACYRVKNYDPQRTYVESRLVGSACNPYLVLAAHVAAGLTGVVNNMPCPAPAVFPSLKELELQMEAYRRSQVNAQQLAAGKKSEETMDDDAVAASSSVLEVEKSKFVEAGNVQSDAGPEVTVVPSSLEDALDALKADKELVMALGEEFVEWFDAVKTFECKQFPDWKQNRDDPEVFEKERNMYYKMM